MAMDSCCTPNASATNKMPNDGLTLIFTNTPSFQYQNDEHICKFSLTERLGIRSYFILII